MQDLTSAWMLAGGLAGTTATAGLWGANRVWKSIRAQGLDRWAPEALLSPPPAHPFDWSRDECDVFIAICDHYEPEWGRPARAESIARVDRWVNEYPRQFARFADCSGRPPQHTYFFPADEYQPEYLDRLSQLVTTGFGEVDIHLHHDNDTVAGLTETLSQFRDVLSHRHGLLRTDPATGRIVYGFIHGNWALCNSRRDRRWCGVDHELPVLLQTGCYADFTFPSAPSDTQPSRINQIYYANDTPEGRCAHEQGTLARVGQRPPAESLLMIQGPLLFDWSRRKWGLLPKVENGDLLGNCPPTLGRLRRWIEASVTVAGKPNWRFIKLHTHGCKPSNTNMLLGEPMVRFHEDLAKLHRDFPNFRYHYVTAWDMAQLVHRAEGVQGAEPSAQLDPTAAPPTPRRPLPLEV